MVAFDRKMFPSIDSAVFDLKTHYQSTTVSTTSTTQNKNENENENNKSKNKDDNKNENRNENENENESDCKNMNNGLWFAARCSSKPGMHGPESMDCWTLVSTPAFAVSEISVETMQGNNNISLLDGKEDKKIVFKPQENEYLNNGPARSLSNTFLDQTEKAIKNLKNIKTKLESNYNNENEILSDENITGSPAILYLQVRLNL